MGSHLGRNRRTVLATDPGENLMGALRRQKSADPFGHRGTPGEGVSRLPICGPPAPACGVLSGLGAVTLGAQPLTVSEAVRASFGDWGDVVGDDAGADPAVSTDRIALEDLSADPCGETAGVTAGPGHPRMDRTRPNLGAPGTRADTWSTRHRFT